MSDEKVVYLFKEPEKIISGETTEASVSGTCFCIACQFEWFYELPSGVTEFECPNCKTMKGRMKYECLRFEEAHFTCNCGNQYFLITPERIYCPNCGLDQMPF